MLCWCVAERSLFVYTGAAWRTLTMPWTPPSPTPPITIGGTNVSVAATWARGAYRRMDIDTIDVDYIINIGPGPSSGGALGVGLPIQVAAGAGGAGLSSCAGMGMLEHRGMPVMLLNDFFATLVDPATGAAVVLTGSGTYNIKMRYSYQGLAG
jgi:hypothetical protein